MIMTFIGGYHNGAKLAIRDGEERVDLLIPRESHSLHWCPSFDDCCYDLEDEQFETETYFRTRISGDGTVFDCFLHYRMKPDAMIEALLEHYHPILSKGGKRWPKS